MTRKNVLAQTIMSTFKYLLQVKLRRVSPLPRLLRLVNYEVKQSHIFLYSK